MDGDIPGWDEGIYTSIKTVDSLVDAKLAYMSTGQNAPLVRQMSAAYLARVRRLIVAMGVLYEAGLPDVMGGVLRICVEAWIIGMWVHYTGNDALERLHAEYVDRSNALITSAKLPGPTFDVIEEKASWVPHIEKVTKAVEKHLVDEDGAEVGELLWSIYKLVYQAESLMSVHAGYASVSGHLDEHPDWTGIRSERQDGNNGSGKLLWAATLLAMLARRVFLEFGLDVTELDRAAEPIQRLAVELNEATALD